MQKDAPKLVLGVSDPPERRERVNTYEFKQKLIAAAQAVSRWNRSGKMELPYENLTVHAEIENVYEWGRVGEQIFSYTLKIEGEGFSDEWSCTDLLSDDIQHPNLPSGDYDIRSLFESILHQDSLKQKKYPPSQGIRAAIAKVLKRKPLRPPQSPHKPARQRRAPSQPESPPPQTPA